MDVTIYFLGFDADEAIDGLPFDSEESAESFRQDQEGGDSELKIFRFTVRVHASDLVPA